MAIARKPRQSAGASAAATVSERDIEALIRKGGSVARHPRAPAAAAPSGEAARVVLRIPAALLEEVDAAVKARSPRIPRHTWLLEAVQEKLEREAAD